MKNLEYIFNTFSKKPFELNRERIYKKGGVIFEKFMKNKTEDVKRTLVVYNAETDEVHVCYQWNDCMTMIGVDNDTKIPISIAPLNKFKKVVYEMLMENIGGALVYRLFHTSYILKKKDDGSINILATKTNECARYCIHEKSAWKETFDGRIIPVDLGFLSHFRFPEIIYKGVVENGAVIGVYDKDFDNAKKRLSESVDVYNKRYHKHFGAEMDVIKANAYDLSLAQKEQKFEKNMPEILKNHAINVPSIYTASELTDRINDEGWGCIDCYSMRVYFKKGEKPLFLWKNHIKKEWTSVANKRMIIKYAGYHRSHGSDASESVIQKQLLSAGFNYEELCLVHHSSYESVFHAAYYSTITSVEQALKMGYDSIADAIISAYLCGRYSDKDAKLSLPDLLGVTGKQLKLIGNTRVADISGFKELFNNPELIAAYPAPEHRIFAVLLRKGCDVSVLCEMRDTMLSLYRKYGNVEAPGLSRDFISYTDYLRMVKVNNTLIKKYDVSFPVSVKPSKIQEEHSRILKFLTQVKQDATIKKYDSKISDIKKNDVSRKTFEYKEESYSIILPDNAADIVREGTTLCHCVGRAGYIEKMASKETTIVFLRNNKAIDTPLITMEINTGGIRQCFGYHDHYNDSLEIKEFIERYAKEKGFPIYACIYREKPEPFQQIAV